MGGHEGGGFASWLAVLAASTTLQHYTRQNAGNLREAVKVAHRAVRQGGRDLGTADMGTTLVAACRQDEGQLALAWVGDSRGYLLRPDGLVQLTDDHNQAAELLRAGQLTSQEARRHPGQHRLTRALGCGREQCPTVDVRIVPKIGRLLLCTDGLYCELFDQDIEGLLAQGTPAAAAERLVNAALTSGGRDNVTVVVVDLDSMHEQGPAAAQRAMPNSRERVADDHGTPITWQSAVLARCRVSRSAGALPSLKELLALALEHERGVTRRQLRGLLEQHSYLEPVSVSAGTGRRSRRRLPGRLPLGSLCASCGVMADFFTGRCRCSG